MKHSIIAGFLITTLFNFGYSQEVEIKQDKVLLDGKAILKYEKINMMEHSFYSLENDDEILLFKSFDNETPKYIEDDFFVLNFLMERVKIETQDFSKIASFMNSKKSMQKLIKWLIKDKVLTVDGKIDVEKLEIFFDKYDENITNRTMR